MHSVVSTRWTSVLRHSLAKAHFLDAIWIFPLQRRQTLLNQLSFRFWRAASSDSPENARTCGSRPCGSASKGGGVRQRYWSEFLRKHKLDGWARPYICQMAHQCACLILTRSYSSSSADSLGTTSPVQPFPAWLAVRCFDMRSGSVKRRSR